MAVDVVLIHVFSDRNVVRHGRSVDRSGNHCSQIWTICSYTILVYVLWSFIEYLLVFIGVNACKIVLITDVYFP